MTDRSPLTREVYARAEGLLGPNLLPTVKNVFVTPHWLPGDGDRFWYRRDTDGGHEDVVIDAATGKRVAADPAELGREVAKVYGESAGADAPWLLKSPDGRRAVASREGNLWLEETGGAARALTTDGTPVAGYGLWPDNWQANVVPRGRSGQQDPPVETYWAPDSRTLLVPYVDQREVAAYPYLESAPFDGSFRPRQHPIRIPLVGEASAKFEWFLIDTQTGERRRVELPYGELLRLQQDMTAYREIVFSADSKHLYLVAHGANMESAYVFEVDTATGQARKAPRSTSRRAPI